MSKKKLRITGVPVIHNPILRWIIIIVPGIIGLIPIMCYAAKFQWELSDSHDDWYKFATIWASLLTPIIGIYTIVGVYFTYNLQASENTRSRRIESFQMFESTFFKLLDIHSQKLNNMEIGNYAGIKAAERLIKLFNYQLRELIEALLITVPDKFSEELIDRWIARNDAYPFFRSAVMAIDGAPTEQHIEILTQELKKAGVPMTRILDDVSNKSDLITHKFDSLPIEQKFALYKKASNKIYEDHGQFYGHYFRNMFMIVRHLEEYEDDVALKFAKLFKAQLSIPEISLLIVNNFGDKSSSHFRLATKKFNLLDGYENNDIFGLPDPVEYQIYD
jgi:hypothetical protein